MKKWIVILLLMITATSMAVPCCQENDACQENAAIGHAVADHDHRDNEENGTCSPFFTCGTCATSIEPPSNNNFIAVCILKKPAHSPFCLSQLLHYHSSFFKPPRGAYSVSGS